MHLISILTAALALAGVPGRPNQAEKSTIEGGKSCTVPFTLARHFILVDVKPANATKTYKFVFDTGLNLTFVDSALAKELGLVKVAEAPASDASGASSKLSIFALMSVQLGACKVTNSIAGGMDLATMSRMAGTTISGILGDNFCRGFRVRIDYRKRQLTFNPEGPATGKIRLKAPNRPMFAAIAVPIQVDGKEVQAIVDSGAHDVGLPATLVERLEYPASEKVRSKGAMTGGLIGAGGKDMLTRVRELRIGNLSLKDYPAFTVQIDKALLGFRFLSQFVTTIDYPQNTVYLEPYDDATFPTNFPTFGMALTKTDKGATVTGLWTGSAADRAGLELGDVVESIDGHSTVDRDQAAIGILLNDPKVATLSLVVKGKNGGKPIQVDKAELFPTR